ncbi:hypothetical protein [Tropicibacter sp. S64]|uniref:hypothetical protein n=1 Tax=Tropicibacter sp. S64 TaxID=3415122 RepID=UPI003C7D8225
MKKTAMSAFALLFAAAGAVAATDVFVPDEPVVIEIEVDAQDFARCQETLAQVAQMPAVTDSGREILFDNTGDMPSVACVVKDT